MPAKIKVLFLLLIHFLEIRIASFLSSTNCQAAYHQAVRPSCSFKPEHHDPTSCPPVTTAESCSSSPSELVEHSSISLLNIQSFNPSAHSTSRWKAFYLEDELRKEQAKNHIVPLIALTETWPTSPTWRMLKFWFSIYFIII